MGAKTGRFSLEEQRFIRENYNKLTATSIAKRLNRLVESVESFLKREGLYGGSYDKETAYDIINTEYWKEIKKQFNEEEQKLFLKSWNEITAQFKNTDILFTERLQMIDVVKLDVLMNRNLSEQAEIQKNIRDFQKMVEEENIDAENKAEIKMSIVSMYGTLKDMGKSYREMLEKKDKLWSALKATRSDRIKQIEQSKSTFSGWITELIKNDEERERIGLYIEKQRLATNKEMERLSQEHVYGEEHHKEIDIPFLTPEVVMEKEKERQEEIENAP